MENNRFSLEERYGYQNRKVIYDKDVDTDIELNNIYPIIDLLNKLDKQIAELKKQLEKNEKLIIDRRDLCLERNDIFEENQQLKQKVIVPKFQIGQTLYMIPTQFNGLIKIKEYRLLSIDLSDIGIRYHLVCKEKERGIEPFYCASESMFGHSIFTTKEEAIQKLSEIKGEEK